MRASVKGADAGRGKRWLAAVSLLPLALGCADRDLAACREAVGAGRFDEGTIRCERLAGDEAALWALRARAGRGDRPGVEKWAARLAGTGLEGESHLAVAEFLQGRDREAAARTFRQAADRLCVRPPRQRARCSEALRGQGRLAWSASRYSEALSSAGRAYQAATDAGDAILQSKALFGVFQTVYDLGDLPAARRILEEATRLASSTSDRDLQTFALFDEGLLATDEGNARLARSAFERVISSVRPGPSASDVLWRSRINLFKMAVDARDASWAAREEAAALELYRRFDLRTRPISGAVLSYHRARLARLAGHAAEAEARLAEAPPAGITPEWRWKMDVERARLAVERKDEPRAVAFYQAAIDTIESLRNNQFDDFRSWVLAEKRAPYAALLALYAQRRQYREALAIAERIQGRTFMDAYADAGHRPADTVAEATHDATVRFEGLAQLFPRLRTSPVLAPRPQDETLAEVAGDDVLQYFETDDRLYVLVLRAGRPTVIAREIGAAALAALARDFAAHPDDGGLASRLGSLLLPEAALAGAGEVIHLVPSAALAKVPFAALRTPQGLLVERHSLAQVPSLTALAAIERTPPAGSARVRVLADTEGDLPQAAAEGAEVAARFGGELLTGKRATSAALRSSQVRLLHLALHSGADPSGVWLALGDGRFRGAEVLDRIPRADLVVLSSCASAATGDPGLWGSLAALFLAAGARGVLASLTSVEDGSGRALMRDFYRNGALEHPARALARTQRAWVGRASATEWAPYVYFGSGREAGVPRSPIVSKD
jgi:tetratricopeptide (TPR) repeat protein